MAKLTIQSELTPEALVLRVAGSLTLDHASDWREALARGWRHSARQVVLDLSTVHFLDTAGAALLVSARHRARKEGRSLALASVSQQGRSLLRLVGLDLLLDSPSSHGAYGISCSDCNPAPAVRRRNLSNQGSGSVATRTPRPRFHTAGKFTEEL